LKKALSQGLKTICVINKIDRDTARSEWVHDKVLELFLDLEADDQFNAPFLYASAKMVLPTESPTAQEKT
ncbi:MAG: translational GTPase TypA, partial [Coraliomargaritaceae bacterium]